ncbi:hypothetical protein ACN9MJ_13625 [Acidovorax facilis]|uniref:hypothetical protein n=1 Tax=Acidovorax facilis TaxID=12917 RepID=UPI00177D5BBD
MPRIVSMGYVSSITAGQYYFLPHKAVMPQMQTVQETRRQRLGLLKEKYGRWVDLNAALNWESTNARLSQIHSGTLRSDRGTPYTMGDDTAREIEQKLNLPLGWMDTPPSAADTYGTNAPLERMAALFAVMEPEMQYKVVRMVAALNEQADGTNGPS